MAMNKNILAIGNGFDLYHGRKTGYRDFIERVEIAFDEPIEERSDLDVMFTELCDVNGFFRHFHFMMPEDLSWTFFEGEMVNIIRALEHFQDTVEVNQRDPEFGLIDFNIIAGLYTYQDLQIFKHFARIFEQVVDDPSGGMFKLRQLYITQDRTLNRRAVIDEVRRELDDFTAALDLYLANCVEGLSAMIMELKENPPDYVINFNYTDTVNFYGVPEEHIYYAKGKAGSNPANLVLGCPAGPRPPMPGGLRPPMEGGPRPPMEGDPRPPMPGGPRPPMPGGPKPPMPFGPCAPGGGPGRHEDWLYFDNDFQKLMKFIGLPDRSQLYPVDGNGNPVPVTVRYFGYSFPMGDAELIRELWDAAGQTIVCYTDREDYARKMVSMMRVLGKDAVRDAVNDGRIVFETIQ